MGKQATGTDKEGGREGGEGREKGRSVGCERETVTVDGGVEAAAADRASFGPSVSEGAC